MSAKPADKVTPDWSPSEAWDILKQRPKPSAVVQAPIKTYSGQQLDQFRIEVLRMHEIRQARLKARAQVLRETGIAPEHLGNDASTAERLQTATALEVLALALRSVKGVESSSGMIYGRLFHDAEELEKMIHEDELTVLMMQYRATQKERGPLVSEMTKEELEAWIVYLAGAKDDHPLSRLTWPALAQLCLYAVRQLAPLLGLTSPASPSEESPNGQASTDETSQTGITSSGLPPVAPGLTSDSPDDGTVPNGADPVEAALLIDSLSSDEE